RSGICPTDSRVSRLRARPTPAPFITLSPASAKRRGPISPIHRGAPGMTNIRPAARLAHGVAALALLACASALPAEAQSTKTPIKHVIVLFQENISFDHYFATYPKAMNLSGERAFQAAPGTPTVNG